MQKTLTYSELLQEIHSYSDEMVLRVGHAAIYLGVEKGTLDHWRSDGLPPPFIKYGAAKSSPVVYELGVLRAFRKSNTFRNTREAQLATPPQSLSRATLTTTHPFWTRGPFVIDSVFALPDTSLFLDPTTDITWCAWNEALCLPWLNEHRRQELMQMVGDSFDQIQARHEGVLKEVPVEYWQSSEFYTARRRWTLINGDNVPFRADSTVE